MGGDGAKGAGGSGAGGGPGPKVAHGGGIVGRVLRYRPMTEAVAAAFAGAPKFHTGGLAADEVPAILQKGEEVLTRDDPRHILNQGPVMLRMLRANVKLPPGPSLFNGVPKFHEGGVVGMAAETVKNSLEGFSKVVAPQMEAAEAGARTGPTRQPVKVTVVNAVDPVSFMSEALGTAEGEEVLLNAIRANADTIKKDLS